MSSFRQEKCLEVQFSEGSSKNSNSSTAGKESVLFSQTCISELGQWLQNHRVAGVPRDPQGSLSPALYRTRIPTMFLKVLSKCSLNSVRLGAVPTSLENVFQSPRSTLGVEPFPNIYISPLTKLHGVPLGPATQRRDRGVPLLFPSWGRCRLQ